MASGCWRSNRKTRRAAHVASVWSSPGSGDVNRPSWVVLPIPEKKTSRSDEGGVVMAVFVMENEVQGDGLFLLELGFQLLRRDRVEKVRDYERK
jgi:hypothetical protein